MDSAQICSCCVPTACLPYPAPPFLALPLVFLPGPSILWLNTCPMALSLCHSPHLSTHPALLPPHWATLTDSGGTSCPIAILQILARTPISLHNEVTLSAFCFFIPSSATCSRLGASCGQGHAERSLGSYPSYPWCQTPGLQPEVPGRVWGTEGELRPELPFLFTDEGTAQGVMCMSHCFRPR